MQALRVSLLGSFQVAVGKEILSKFAANKVRALLVYLVAEMDQPHSRESLAEMFWPDTPTQTTLANLRYALADLRKVTGDSSAQPPYLLIHRDSLQFNASSNCSLDALEFIELIRAGSIESLKRAVALYRGEFLEGFPSIESLAFEEWLLLRREQYRRETIEALRVVADHHEQRGEYRQALPFARREVELEPWLEEAHQQLMRILALDGQHSAALAQYEACRDSLASELNVEPAPETTRLYESIRSGQLEKVPLLLKRDLPAPGVPPFKGLQYFEETDADLFFGREALVSRLIDQVRSRRETRGPQFLSIIGASGSGKSSLVRAGLIPALKRGGTSRIVVTTPTERPLEPLALARKNIRASERPVLFVDQFEELFTLCHNETERRTYIKGLLESPPKGFALVIIALRADFYAACAPYEKLRRLLSQNQEYIGPMNAAELRKAIEEPARTNGWLFEPGLVDLLLHDIGADGDRNPEPGALPLLSHALLETWHRRSGRILTLSGYGESGGIRQAIAQTAETVFARLSPEQQNIARNIFLRLTDLGEGTQETRRRVFLSELIPSAESASLMGRITESVLRVLSDARLVTTTEATAEVAHEALIREWSRLHEWLTENREGLLLHRRITESAQEWETRSRDRDLVYRGTRLAQALEWADSHASDLNLPEREFLHASRSIAEQEEAERERQRHRELDAAQKLAESERSSSRRLRIRNRVISVVGAIGLILALLAGIFAFNSNRNARRVEQEAGLATSRELAAASTNNLQVDPERSILLALQALSTSDTLEARNALHQAISADRLRATLAADSKTVFGVAASPTAPIFATAGLDGTVKVWKLSGSMPDQTPQLTLSNPIDFDPVDDGSGETVAFAPDGKQLAAISAGKAVKVWDVSSGQLLHTLTGHSGDVYCVIFSPDGKYLATGSDDSFVRLWEVATGKEILTLTGHTGSIYSLAFSPDGKHLASGSFDQTLKVWDLGKLADRSAQQDLSLSFDDYVQAIAFSPDGRRLAMGVGVGIQIWDLDPSAADLAPKLSLNLAGHGNAVISLAFGPNGRWLVSGGGEGNAKVWDATTGQELFVLAGDTGGISSTALTSDGTRLLTANVDGTLKVWDLTPAGNQEWFNVSGYNGRISADGQHLITTPTGLGAETAEFELWDISSSGIREDRRLSFDPGGTVSAIAFLRDLSRVATVAVASPENTMKLTIWDTITDQQVQAFQLAGPTDVVFGLDFSPDGERLATGSDDGTAQVWNVATGKELLALNGHTAAVRGIAYSPHGERLATAGFDGTAKIWDAQTGQLILTLSGHKAAVISVAFSPDGKLLATASGDKTVKIWDVLNGQTILTLNGHASGVFSVAFSPDGMQIASGGLDNIAKVWDLADGRELLTFSGMRVEFTPDGKRLVTFGVDRITRGFFLETDELVALAKSRLTREFTIDECQKYLHVNACPAQ